MEGEEEATEAPEAMADEEGAEGAPLAKAVAAGLAAETMVKEAKVAQEVPLGVVVVMAAGEASVAHSGVWWAGVQAGEVVMAEAEDSQEVPEGVVVREASAVARGVAVPTAAPSDRNRAGPRDLRVRSPPPSRSGGLPKRRCS